MIDLDKELLAPEFEDEAGVSGIALLFGMAITALIAGALLWADSVSLIQS